MKWSEYIPQEMLNLGLGLADKAQQRREEGEMGREPVNWEL